MLQLALLDTYSEALAALPDRLRTALLAKANELAAALQAKIQQKLSGGVLNQKSGALAGSIVATIDDASDGVAVTIATSPDIKYAAIHEYGGVIPPHEIVPDKAKALAFVLGGKRVFVKRVNLPAITMPERSYMRSSLEEMAGEISREFTGEIIQALD